MKPLLHTSGLFSLLAACGFLMLGPGLLQAADADIIDGWQQFERRVREERISAEDGLRETRRWAGALQRAYPAEGFDGRIFFPLSGYGLRHVGGKRGEGFRPGRYRFIGPNRRSGHPAQDIFVYDGNQDSLEDHTGRPVKVLALAEGIVVSIFADWTPTPGGPGDSSRGGNYIWIYHPALRMFAYYAHLQTIQAALGQRAAGGQPIATLGRTGVNAFAERSPTHLHLMLLRAYDMIPVDPYLWLKQQEGGQKNATPLAAAPKSGVSGIGR